MGSVVIRQPLHKSDLTRGIFPPQYFLMTYSADGLWKAERHHTDPIARAYGGNRIKRRCENRGALGL